MWQMYNEIFHPNSGDVVRRSVAILKRSNGEKETEWIVFQLI